MEKYFSPPSKVTGMRRLKELPMVENENEDHGHIDEFLEQRLPKPVQQAYTEEETGRKGRIQSGLNKIYEYSKDRPVSQMEDSYTPYSIVYGSGYGMKPAPGLSESSGSSSRYSSTTKSSSSPGQQYSSSSTTKPSSGAGQQYSSISSSPAYERKYVSKKMRLKSPQVPPHVAKMSALGSDFQFVLPPAASPYYPPTLFYEECTPRPSTSGNAPPPPRPGPPIDDQEVINAMTYFRKENPRLRNDIIAYLRHYKEKQNPAADAKELIAYGCKKLRLELQEREARANAPPKGIPSEPSNVPVVLGKPPVMPKGLVMPTQYVAPRPPQEWVHPSLHFPGYPRAPLEQVKDLADAETDPKYLFQSPGGTLFYNSAQREYARSLGLE